MIHRVESYPKFSNFPRLFLLVAPAQSADAFPVLLAKFAVIEGVESWSLYHVQRLLEELLAGVLSVVQDERDLCGSRVFGILDQLLYDI